MKINGLVGRCAFWHLRYVNFEFTVYIVICNINCDVFPLDILIKVALNAKKRGQKQIQIAIVSVFQISTSITVRNGLFTGKVYK